LNKAQLDELNAMSIPDLKDRLKENDQVVGKANKNDLITRIAACIVEGCFPRCPKCFGGKLKEATDGTYFCPGAFDDDKFAFCSYKADTSDRPAWKPAAGKLV